MTQSSVHTIHSFPAGSGDGVYVKEIAAEGVYYPSGVDEPFIIDGETLLHWYETTKERLNKGVEVPLYDQHIYTTEEDAISHRVGEMLDVALDDRPDGKKSIIATFKFAPEHEPKSLSQVSVGVCSEKDGDGSEYDETIDHVAVTDCPIMQGLRKFQPRKYSRYMWYSKGKAKENTPREQTPNYTFSKLQDSVKRYGFDCKDEQSIIDAAYAIIECGSVYPVATNVAVEEVIPNTVYIVDIPIMTGNSTIGVVKFTVGINNDRTMRYVSHCIEGEYEHTLPDLVSIAQDVEAQFINTESCLIEYCLSILNIKSAAIKTNEENRASADDDIAILQDVADALSRTAVMDFDANPEDVRCYAKNIITAKRENVNAAILDFVGMFTKVKHNNNVPVRMQQYSRKTADNIY